MNSIANFEQMFSCLQASPRRVRIAIINGVDASTVEAIERAVVSGFAAAVFVGSQPVLENYPALAAQHMYVTQIPVEGDKEAAQRAVQLVREGQADFLMKGLLHTSDVLRAVLHKEEGLLPQGEILTHIAVAELPKYDKLLFFTDSAVMPEPTNEQRERQIAYATAVAQAFGIAVPKISLIHFTEEVSEKFPLTLHYRSLAAANAAEEDPSVVIDGPLDVRTSVDPVALSVKGIASPLRGQADVLVFPNLEAGNTFYKTISFFGEATVAGILCGTTCPVVINSRGDDAVSKFYSLAVAATVVRNGTTS